MPSLRGLHALANLARAGSLSAAATTLGVTRSALSHRIADLEHHLGVTLIRPDGRKVALTEDAQSLLSALGDSIERIEAAVTPLHRRSTELRLSTVATLASLWLLPRLGHFQQRHPDISVTISTTQRAVDFETEDIDCAIRHGLGEWEGLGATLLFRDALVPVAAPGLAGGIGQAPIIRARSRMNDWQSWWRGAARDGRPPTDGPIVETGAQAMAAAIGSAGIALMETAYVEEAVRTGALKLLGPEVELEGGYWFVHRPRPRNSRLVDAMKTWLVSVAVST